MRKTWQTKEWKNAVKAFTKGKRCQWCGSTDKITAHHPYYSSGSDPTIYLDLYLSGCIILCNRCHFAVHHSLILCPRCKTHYMGIGADVCYSCYVLSNPALAESMEIAKEKKKRAQREYAKKKRLEAKEFKKAQDLRRKESSDSA